MQLRLASVSVLVLLASTPLCKAATINVSDLNIFRDTRADNDVGIAQGDVLQFGANISGGSAGYSIQGILNNSLLGTASPCGPLAVNASFCAKSAQLTAANLNSRLAGTWQVQLSNGTTTQNFSLPLTSGIPIAPIPFPTSVTISPSVTVNGDPTLNWSLPANVVGSASTLRVNVYDKSDILANGQANIIQSTNIPLNASGQFTPSVSLKPGGNYAIGFQIIQTRDGAILPVGSGNADILTRSNSFFDFSPPSAGSPAVINLPSITHDGVYNFHVDSVGPNKVTFIDPAVATGYIYATGVGDPNFASVTLPNLGGGHFLVSFTENGMAITDNLDAGVQFFFGGLGVSTFEVTGINTSAMLDPTNGNAFVTGLTFVTDGSFTGTMTPITTEVAAVPESSTWAMMMLGFIGLGLMTYRRKERGVFFRRMVATLGVGKLASLDGQLA